MRAALVLRAHIQGIVHIGNVGQVNRAVFQALVLTQTFQYGA